MTKRIGLIGCGRWGRLILRDLLACGAEVHVICQTTSSTAQALELGARSAGTDLAALAPMDGFVVATPTITHADILDQLVGTGRPIFVEKPMTADVVSARRLAAAADGRLFVMDKWRYHPGIEAMRREIASGGAGDVLAIRTERWGWGNPHADVSALWILAPHDLAITLHLTGEIPPVRAAFPASAREPGHGATIILGADGSSTVTIDIGIASPAHRRRCLVIGSRATLELRDGYDQRIFVRDGAPGQAEAVERAIEVEASMPLLTEIASFLGHLAGGPAPMSTAQEGLLIVERIAQIETMLKARTVSAA